MRTLLCVVIVLISACQAEASDVQYGDWWVTVTEDPITDEPQVAAGTTDQWGSHSLGVGYIKADKGPEVMWFVGAPIGPPNKTIKLQIRIDKNRVHSVPALIGPNSKSATFGLKNRKWLVDEMMRGNKITIRSHWWGVERTLTYSLSGFTKATTEIRRLSGWIEN